MSIGANNLISSLKDPMKEIEIIRTGINSSLIEDVLEGQSFVFKDVLTKLDIPEPTDVNNQPLDSISTEKLLRLISIMNKATEILGKTEAKNWLYSAIPSLDEQVPIDLLDTAIGYNLVEQTLLQIKYGIYN